MFKLLLRLTRLRALHRRAVRRHDPALADRFIAEMEDVLDDPVMGELALVTRIGAYNTQAQLLRLRFKRQGSLPDLRRAAELFEAALDIARREQHRAFQASMHNNAAMARDELFGATGERDHLAAAVRHAEAAMDRTDPGSPDLGAHTSTLAQRRMRLFRVTGDLAYLQAGIEAMELALRRMDSDADRAKVQNNLAHALRYLHRHTGDPSVLARAHDLAAQALAATGEGHPEYLDALNTLAVVVTYRAGVASDPVLLATGIEHFRRLLSRVGADAPLRPAVEHNLADALSDLFHVTGDRAALDEAISLLRDVVERTDPSDPQRVARLADLGRRLLEHDDRAAAGRAFEEACRTGLAVQPEAVLLTGRGWGDASAAMSDWSTADTAYGHAIRAVDQLLRVQLVDAYRDPWLATATGLHARGARAAVRVGDPRKAAGRLEHGRAFALSHNLALDRIAEGRLVAAGHTDLGRRLAAARQRLSSSTSPAPSTARGS